MAIKGGSDQQYLALFTVFYHLLRQEGQFVPDEILTLPEVAQLLKVAEKTIYTTAQCNEIPAFKVRGQWRFRRADLDQWIERQKIPQHAIEIGPAPFSSGVRHGASRRHDDH